VASSLSRADCFALLIIPVTTSDLHSSQRCDITNCSVISRKKGFFQLPC